MSPPRRRSSRLRGVQSSPRKPMVLSSHRLSCLTERDESLGMGAQSTPDPVTSSPMIPRTPATAGRIRPPFEEMHPSKAHSTSSPSFDFRFAHPAPALGPDAQRMMDGIREEALRIKAQLAAQREEEKHSAVNNGSAAPLGRKFATPKGKVGRFSDVHIAEFKKMDSIAGHPSAFRAQPDRFAPSTKSLKRSQSKAQLDSRERIVRSEHTPSQPQSLENTPAKRVRVAENQHFSQGLSSNPVTPKLSRSQSILGSITTPTQASLARAASVKQQSQIPSLSHSPSKYSMSASRGLPKSATMNNVTGSVKSESNKDLSASPSKFDRFKSMLRRPTIGMPKPADSMHKPVPMTSASRKPDLDKDLPSLPTPLGLGRADTSEHVNVTPRSTARNIETLQSTPSPLKSGLPRSISSMRLGNVRYPSLASRMTQNISSQNVEYPNLAPADVFSKESTPSKAQSSPPSVPGTFTFRSDQTISFGASPRGFGPSTGQSSIRQVRPSLIPGTMPVSGSCLDGNKENNGRILSMPHDIPNKKRRHVDSDEEEDKTMRDSPAKRQKGHTTDLGGPAEAKSQPEHTSRKSKAQNPAKKGVLSLSRLNMLARPKLRK